MSTPAPADLPIRVPITWSEILRTPDGRLRRLLAGRYRNAVHDIRTHAATQTIELAPENTGPPEPAEVAYLRTSIAALADRARRIRQAKNDDTDRPYRDELNRMLDVEARRLEQVAAGIYERMAAEYTARIQAGERLHPTLTVDHEEDAA